MFRKRKAPTITSYTSNPALVTIKPDWKGTPLDENGLFMNHEYPWRLEFSKIFKFIFHRNPQKEIKKQDTWRIPVLKNDQWLIDPTDKIVWLGHASFFIQLSGIRILIDPVYGKLPVVARFSDMPVAPNKLLNIDYILVSHAHYDHCDKNSIKLLTGNNPRAQILTGLNLNKLISKWTGNKIQTAGWYQQYKLESDLKITFLPSRHWANRTLFDVNTTLWGGFMIEKDEKCIYFSGDSANGSHFNDIGELFQNINIALIGVGAYAPAWFMEAMHQNPYDAVKAFRATHAKTFIPFHYGTFDLSDEPLEEPQQILNKLNAEGKIENTLKILKLGEVFYCQ
ncbi:MAG TPA: MBL fold metallo-hydrolase [Bacteroidia bacterium]|jgi:L-ascorbate metabolism protein UlaG (beta-lactamase superfamily)|nr:MBL fold metallo-hydrolase [Bacteroidia bacterium]